MFTQPANQSRAKARSDGMDPFSGQMLTWTLAVQLGIVAITTISFLVLGRATATRESQLWMFAWLANLVATAAGFFFAVSVASSDVVGQITWSQRPLLMTYAAGRALFGLLVVRGLWRYARPVLTHGNRLGVPLLAAAVWGIVSGALTATAGAALPLQLLAVGGILALGALLAWRSKQRQISAGLTITVGSIGLVYIGYVALAIPALLAQRDLPAALEATALAEAAAELVLAFALLVALEGARSRQIDELSGRLQTSYEKLRKQTDVDPLTGLKNRRTLRQVLLEAPDASLIYVDVDGFKAINERFGHEIGDECLTRTAFELSRAFRPSDHFFRLGGDEFLVVAPELNPEQAHERTEGVRATLLQPSASCPSISLSVGIVGLSEETSPDEALREADRRVLRAKQAAAS